MNPFLKSSIATAACFAFTALNSAAFAQTPDALCAGSEAKARIAEAVTARRGAPPVIYARNLDLPEAMVMSGLPDRVKAYGVEATPERVKEIWASIDAWGEETFTHIVLTMGGDHVADFPSLVPITQPDDGSGFIDIYADGGDGVHGHIFLDFVKAVYAAELAGPDGVTRTVSFYNKDGGLIAGMYPSIAGKGFDQKAVDGFDRTVRKLKDYAPLCE